MAPVEQFKRNDTEFSRDLSHAAIVIFSGGPVDFTNPPEVRHRMDQIITDLNADPWILANTGNKGLIFKLLAGQQTNYIHQSRWRDVCASPALQDASPLVLIGHSNGGAAAMNVARFLHDRGKQIDVVFTADSVFTLDDNGDPYEVPPNVELNLNSYSIPVDPIWWTAPFPHGKRNQRQVDGSLAGLLNVGLPFPEPGVLEHRNVFYDLAGGDLQGADYQYPQLIRDASLAVLQGGNNQEIFDLAQSYLQLLADKRNITVALEGDGIKATIEPEGQAQNPATVPISPERAAELHKRMKSVEELRLAVPNPEPL